MSNDLPEPEACFDLAYSAARRWYYSRIRNFADDAIRAIRDGEATPDDLGDYLHESIDGSNLVIYTGKASMACLASDNEGAYEDEMGEPAPTVEARAYWAIMADVTELLEARRDEWKPGHMPDTEDPRCAAADAAIDEMKDRAMERARSKGGES